MAYDTETPNSEAERRAFRAWKTGVEADCRDLDGDDKRIRGEFLARLLRGQIVTPVASILDPTFCLMGARIEGRVMLDWAVIDRPLGFTNGCAFQNGFDANEARLKALSFNESQMTGTLSLINTVIDGQFSAVGARFDAKRAEYAIQAQGVTATGWFMDSTEHQKTEVRGTLFMSGADLSGQFKADGARFDAGERKNAIQAQGARATGWFMNSTKHQQTEVRGTLFMSGADLSGQFSANGALFGAGEREDAIQAQGVTATGWFMNSTKHQQTEVRGTLFMMEADLSGQFAANGALFDAGEREDAIMAQRVRAIGWFMNATATHRTEVLGTLFMAEADLSGQFSANGVRFDAGERDYAIVAQRAAIKGGVFLMKAGKTDEPLFPTIRGSANFDSAEIENGIFTERLVLEGSDGKPALNLENAEIDGRVQLHVQSTSGTVLAKRLTVKGEVILAGHFGDALDFSDAKLGGFTPPDRVPKGGLSLANARLGVLRDTADSWAPADDVDKPEDAPITLRGLNYHRLENPLGGGDDRHWKKRLKWLNRQPKEDLTSNFTPQPWRQLALHLRRSGHDADAKNITVRRRTTYRKSKSCSPLSKFGLVLLDLFGGYGFRPLRTVGWSIFVIVITWGVFFHASMGCDPAGCFSGDRFIPISAGDVEIQGELLPVSATSTFTDEASLTYTPYPTFDPLLFAIDLFIPLVEFGATDTWVINDQFTGPLLGNDDARIGFWLQWFGVFVRFLGAFLSAYAIAGFAGLLTREEE